MESLNKVVIISRFTHFRSYLKEKYTEYLLFLKRFREKIASVPSMLSLNDLIPKRIYFKHYESGI